MNSDKKGGKDSVKRLMDFNSGIYTVLDVQTDYYEKAEGFNWQSWKTVRACLHKRW